MRYIIDLLLDFNIFSTVFRIFLAALIGGLIGSERGRHGRAAGLRTHILVCVGSVMTALTGLFIVEAGLPCSDVTRISAQVISGIGFLGAGTILVKNNSIVTGLTTAAGMWITAAIGIAIGFGFYLGAIIAAFICIFSFTALSFFERKRKMIIKIYIELSDVSFASNVIDRIKEVTDSNVSLEAVPPKSNKNGALGIICSYYNKGDDIKNNLKSIEHVEYILDEN